MVAFKTNGPLYESLANEIARLIDTGTFRSGDRIPSVREMRRQHRVSAATVVQAYVSLENRGLIEARPKSGFFVRARWSALLPEMKPSTPPAQVKTISSSKLLTKIFDMVGRPGIVPLGAACPSVDLLPAEKLSRMLRAVDRNNATRALSYDTPPGCEPLRRQIAKRSLVSGENLEPSEIITTVGCMEALHLSLRATTKPGDVIALESPNYFGLLHAIRELQLRVVEIPAHPRDGMDIEALARAVKRHKIAACLAVPNFNNPLGSVMPDANKREMVELLARKAIPLIEDDLYGDLHFGPTRPRTAKSFDRHGLVLLCSSFSKTLAPGFRVGWVAPGRFFDRVKMLKITNTVGTATLPQLAIAEFLQNGGYERYLRGVRQIYSKQVQRISEAVAELFPKGTSISRPSGGFVIWIGLPKECDAITLHEKALERNISIAPGPLFSAANAYKNFIRLNCGQLWSREIERALVLLGDLAKRQLE